ncbi:PP2C family protein-serine/threonine phosphatase [Desulfovibrio sp. Huiquan2017]|uniref:PP2C family protein-serine/threonine phosphatase n=1 Tax=Desulfovibrio sp. Huiquan2017 TaxID=2816861 RepID=UPI002570D4A0|nr:PP2C family protein-serine/threonine phosphatase [Desulfovibrio sp. Huiquan2017]
MTSLSETVRNLSVERKLSFVLLVTMVLSPLTIFIILQSGGKGQATNALIALIVASIILLVPFAKWMSHFLALRAIRELNDQCQRLKDGGYDDIGLPRGSGEGHDFQKLKWNMHWMGYTLATREIRLRRAMADLSRAQRQIGESLDCASLIQTSFLPKREGLFDYIPDHFLIWEQRDVVGGDAYWFQATRTGFLLGVIDCTGHGVPGAFMTLIVTSLLRKATEDTESPAQVLARMNVLIKDALRQNGRDARSDHGMDCALCHVDRSKGRLTFAGANTPLYFMDGDGVEVVKGDRCGLGYVRSPRDFEFNEHDIQVERGMRFYLASDGLVDQVGGERGFPYGRTRLEEFLDKGKNSPIAAQGLDLAEELRRYQGQEKRRDDITIIGFEL